MKNAARLCSLLGSVLISAFTDLGWTDEKRTDTAPADEYAIFETTLTCEEANRTAHRAVERLGYQVTAFSPATTDKVGELKGSRTGMWGEPEPVVVQITCGTEGIQVDSHPEIPPCEQANRISRLAVERLGYQVTEFTPAAVGKPGIVKGEKQGEQPAAITLFCDGKMVVMETHLDSPLLRKKDFYTTISDFRRGFFAMFKAQRSVVASPHLIPSGDHVQVRIKPLSKGETKLVFGAEVTQVLPVQVEISNPTKHPYLLEAEKIVLVSLSGERIKPVNEKGKVFPTPMLVNQSLAPGTNVKGYLYYPLGTYTGARGSFIEEKSQEREGFEVPFN